MEGRVLGETGSAVVGRFDGLDVMLLLVRFGGGTEWGICPLACSVTIRRLLRDKFLSSDAALETVPFVDVVAPSSRRSDPSSHTGVLSKKRLRSRHPFVNVLR